MNKIAKRLVAGASTAAVAAALAVAAAAPASAASLAAWDRTGFSGTKLVDSATANAVIDVVNDRTRSARNTLSFGYSARNTVSWWSVEVAYFPSGYELSSFGGANDTVDHFDRVG
ncbi:hypothetical protein [Streptomyces sp. AC495_CC817]|uniref:hypothetical protein n=1 Tax=Streptomyces sp. AC495_CC817 TaxID=2823900 RepID=UPI001C25DC16|nr:hypothetical protein [Streptomyces sp. AC495_CC817]